MPDGKSQWTPPKSRTVYTKDNKQSNQYDSVDTSCFGSSVNYGGRDYYGISGHKQSTESNDVRNCQTQNCKLCLQLLFLKKVS